jgi:hypothetical protein
MAAQDVFSATAARISAFNFSLILSPLGAFAPWVGSTAARDPIAQLVYARKACQHVGHPSTDEGPAT